MSRTKILMNMDNNNFNSQLSGFFANSTDDIDLLFDKLSKDDKQYHYNELNFSDLDGLLAKSKDFDSSNGNYAPTYTLDELVDLSAAVVPSDCLSEEPCNFNNAFDQVNVCSTSGLSNVLIETAIGSPLSASSEESCDLEDLLFQDEDLPLASPQILEFVNNEAESKLETEQVTEESNGAVLEMADSNAPQNLDFNTLCMMLFQNQMNFESQGDSISEFSEESVTSPCSSLSSESVAELGNEDASNVELDTLEDSNRFKPYTKSRKSKTPEQRQRKKVQNRNAASRYRSKKKDELKSMNEEAEALETKNKELRGKVEGLRKEIDYLRDLMLDVIKARLAKGTLPANFLSEAV